jgi:hypothetical protein
MEGRKGPEVEEARTALESVRWQTDAASCSKLKFREISGPPSTDGRRTTQTVTPWEGPFIVAEVTRPGSYRLTQMDGTKVGNSWNIEHLKKFYP